MQNKVVCYGSPCRYFFSVVVVVVYSVVAVIVLVVFVAVVIVFVVVVVVVAVVVFAIVVVAAVFDFVVVAAADPFVVVPFVVLLSLFLCYTLLQFSSLSPDLYRHACLDCAVEESIYFCVLQSVSI